MPLSTTIRKFLFLTSLLLQQTGHLSAQEPVADPLVDSLTRLLPTAKEDSNKVKLLMDLGNNIGYYNPEKALEYAKQGMDLSARIKYPTGLARTTYLAGNTYLDLGNYSESKAMLDRAEELFSALGRTDMIGMINNARGNWYYMQSDMWNAAHFYTKATEIFHDLKDTIRETIPYQNLIAALGETKNYEKAIALSEKLLVILEARGDSLQAAHTRNHIILNNVALGRLDEAGKFIPSLLDFIKHTLDYNLAADSYNVIGEFFLNKKQYDTAITYYNLALERALRNNYQPAQYNLSIGTAYLKKRDFQRAFEFLNNAVDLSREANSKDIYYRACLPLSEYYQQKNNYQLAYHYLSEYTKLNDSILVAETRQYSTHLEAVFENSKKENRILILQAAELKKTLELRRRNNYLYIGSLLFLLAIILFLLKTRNDQHKRKLLEKDKKLKEEKILSLEKEQQVISLQSMITGQETERTRVAKDLHDGLGGLFSTVKMYFSSLEHQQPSLSSEPLFIKSLELADTASVELRRIAHNLMPEILLKLGLVNAVRDLANNINLGKLLKTSVQDYGMETRLANSTEIMLYRIIQELLNNIIKHSHATDVLIQFNRHGERLSITIEDNGRGFNVNDESQGSTAGIGTVRSRVDYLNGELNIDSKDGVGTTVMMEFLLTENQL